MSRSRFGPRANWFPSLTDLLAGFVVCSILSCQRSPQPESPASTGNLQANNLNATGVNDEQIVAFCSGCHAMPRPTSFPADAWYDEVKRGFDFYHQSERKDLFPPPVQPVVEYFRSKAPAKLEISLPKSVPGPDRLRFRTVEINATTSRSEPKPVAISFVGKWPRGNTAEFDVVFSDMANGGVFLSQFQDAKPVSQLLAELNNPAVVSRCDLNGNGRIDMVIADLGSFNPSDHDQGRVLWLADVEDRTSGKSCVSLAVGLGRVADVQPADVDADGDIDLIVAEFGWHKTGRILLLRNDGDRGSPVFSMHVIDRRPGTIHVPIIDFNRDGRPDFVALISQEFEVIELFLNQGNEVFEKHRIHAAGDPAFGSSGIQVVDLDGDGDDDVLYTNGDMFDSFHIKPYHGIQWLENTGRFPFIPHRLTIFPGAYRALAGDLDQDGDFDIVAGAFVPAEARETDPSKSLESLIWLEQLRPGEFVRHSLETGNCVHAAMDVADLDDDGDLDIAVGSFRDAKSPNQSAITIWWNNSSHRAKTK